MSGHEAWCHNSEITPAAAVNFIKIAEQNNVTYLNFWLKDYPADEKGPGPISFEEEGRYETEAESSRIHEFMHSWLSSRNTPLIQVDGTGEERVRSVLWLSRSRPTRLI